MDDVVADDIVDVHWQHLANALAVGAYDDNLDDLRAAELRRTPPRDAVLDRIDQRMTQIDQQSADDTESGVGD